MSFNVKILFVFVVFLLNQSFCYYDFENENVKVLTSTNFTSEIEENNYFVMFFAPWCGWSKKLIPIWKQLSDEIILDQKVVVKIGSVDCTNNQTELCDENNIHGYPLMKFFKLNVNGSIMFDDEWEIPIFKEFINNSTQVLSIDNSII